MSHLTGNVLHELNLSSSSDISELLGCFEQYNAIRHYRLVIEHVERYINAYSCRQFEKSTEEFTKRKVLIGRWLAFTLSNDDSSASFVENKSRGFFRSLPLLIDIIENLLLDLENDSEHLSKLFKTVKKLQDDQRKLLYPAKFEWVTGLLIKAIENGEWIVLENANLCNPTVLDRINSLVEQSVSITLNECGTIEGKPMVLHPHPRFRMFLTVNPTYGEVSRAMRNRGVEVFLMEPYGENEVIDVKRFLALSDIPGEYLIDSMAKAHLSAKKEGLKHNVTISNLELMRWIQLFQRLVTNGNQTMWSLKISFEHTYLSSLGDIEGKDIVHEAIGSYLSLPELQSDCSLCLPGGWPTTLRVHDFVWYSTETSVKQNVMYLEYLGAQMASHFFRASRMCHSDSMSAYLVDSEMLYAMTFPKADVAKVNQTRVDFALLNKKLLFAANWSMEQATESDLKLYLSWFKWLGEQLDGYCSFFSSFRKLIEKELEHSIWKCIRNDRAGQSTPMLSLAVGKSTPSVSESSRTRAVKCVGLLRVSYQQWHTESEFKDSDKTRCFIPVLQSLRRLEERVLDMIIESPHFDALFELYKKLIDDHLSAWSALVSSQFDCLLISWRSLMKDAKKLKEFFVKEVEVFENEMKNMERPLSLSSQRSLLWAYGGHPSTPSSVEIYRKQQQLVNLCHSIWTTNINLHELATKGSTEAAVSINSELRFLAMQGVCMSAFITSKVDKNDLDVLNQLEEMYQVLRSKYHHEQEKMKRNAETIDQDSFLGGVSGCCTMNADMLCIPSGFNCWLDTVPLNDNNSFGLDMKLLQELSNIISVDGKEVESGLSSLRGLLESTLKFSLNFSSRPPTDFSPYQKISWVLEAWTSVNNAHEIISGTVLEMWFNWHSSLWKHHSNREKKSLSQLGNSDLVPDMLFQPVATLSLDKILGHPIGIKDINAHSLKLGVASRNLWLSSPHVAKSHDFFLKSATSLFQQMILAHKKSFEAEKYSLIRSVFFSHQKADVRAIVSLLESSTHHVLKSLITPFIKPLLHALYVKNSTGSLFDLGCAWLRIGGLRYHLLLCCDKVDPAVKKNLKYFQLTERIASLELEIQVLKECVQLAGCFSLSQTDKEKAQLLKDLKSERNMLQKLVVFRPDPGKFNKLRSECDEFMKLVETPFGLLNNIGNISMQRVADQVHNWQETATRFVDRLSNEYSEYVDIIQPVQIAIYEMKLGLSLVISSSLRDQFLERVGQKNIDTVLGAIYSFMRFPRGMPGKDVSCIDDIFHAKLSSFDRSFPTYMGEDDMDMVEKLITFARDNDSDEAASALKLKASIHENVLLRVVHYVAHTHLLDNASFMLMHKMFDEFANLWMKMKIQVRSKEELDSQQYKFKSRAFDIKNVIEMDVSTLESSIGNEAFSEWQELAAEKESAEVENKNADEEDGLLEKDWNLLLESTSFSHNQNIVFNCMWRQKQLFDAMCDMLHDECLLLKSVENSHLNNCQSVRVGAGQIRLFLEKFAPDFKKSKEVLDGYLFGDGGGLISTEVVLSPYGITKQMEQFVQQNLLLIKDFKEKLHAIRKLDSNSGLAKDVLLDHFEDIFKKASLLDEYYNSAMESRNQIIQDNNDVSKAEAEFTESVMRTCNHILDGFDRVNSVNNNLDSTEEDYLKNINTWQALFASRVESLQLKSIQDELVKTIEFAGRLMELYGNGETSVCLVEAHLKHLYSLLDLMITFGNGILKDFMVAHRTLSMVTHALAEIFASLYSQGFGGPTETQEEEDGGETKDTTGTGMGEGAGVKDVSDQIEDEDQLLGTEKGDEQEDALNGDPSKNDKGIEMEQDFTADTFSVSEDSEDENDDESEEPELDSAMGETGDDSEVVDEKLGDDKDDENKNKEEKYETGPSVKDNDTSGRELRAIEEDDDDATNGDEPGELDNSKKQNDENDDQVPDEDNNDVEDMNIDKDEAFSEPSGLKPDGPEINSDEDIDMNQDQNEDERMDALDDSAEVNNGEDGNNNSVEENLKLY